MSRYGDESCTGKGEIEFIHGVLRGIRSFQLDPSTGYLTGVTLPARWTEGIMEAQCLQTKTDGYLVTKPGVLRFEPKNDASIDGYDFRDGVPFLKADHSPAPCPGLARGNHGCGFYAHHGGVKPGQYYTSGVIEMFGQVELGPQGLRSSKARLVALLHPTVRGMRPETIRVCGGIIRANEKRISELLDSQPDESDEAAHKKWRDKLDLASRYLLSAQKHEEGAFRDLNLWDSHTRFLYPNTPVFDSMESMLEEFPTPPLDHLFQEES